MNIIGIIPARFQSTRFPGKPLVMIDGKLMIQRVYEQACKANTLTEVIVATDDERIKENVDAFGGKSVMTSSRHLSGTDRCFEAVQKLGGTKGFDVVVNIQGDEPFINPLQIDQLAKCFEAEKVEIATLKKKIASVEELFNPNVVKVITNDNREAIYFSRHPIPYIQQLEQEKWLTHFEYYKHIGIYAYRTGILEKITKLKPGSLEKAESLEQLRWIENNFVIFVETTTFKNIAVDTPQDLDKLKPKLL